MQYPKQTKDSTGPTVMTRSKAIEYAISFHEFKFFYLIYVFEKLIDNYY